MSKSLFLLSLIASLTVLGQPVPDPDTVAISGALARQDGEYGRWGTSEGTPLLFVIVEGQDGWSLEIHGAGSEVETKALSLKKKGRRSVFIDGDGDRLVIRGDGAMSVEHAGEKLKLGRVYLTVDGEIPRSGQPGVIPPVFTHKASPSYPDDEPVRDSVYVIFEVVCRKDGRMSDIEPVGTLKSGGFVREAKKALRRWKFKPGKVNGVPADVGMTLKIDFVVR
jgi:hypothetical protein